MVCVYFLRGGGCSSYLGWVVASWEGLSNSLLVVGRFLSWPLKGFEKTFMGTIASPSLAVVDSIIFVKNWKLSGSVYYVG